MWILEFGVSVCGLNDFGTGYILSYSFNSIMGTEQELISSI